ncbi:60S ribosomal protein L18a-like protein [Impatiens glandulifera]|uniref:60S ribosomal protein L18a-like protein n=1 Tax=Impatiens glandulifera TaxID=253017 RepID=UPI001FB06D6F|nr:60S ribosomal protein L18a-like protein [Impatiens glandulifera]
MMINDKARGVATNEPPPPQPSPYYYGTFQGVANYCPPPPSYHPTIGLPPPAPPMYPGAGNPHLYYSLGYQTVPAYTYAEGRHYSPEHRLPCCGLGIGWLLFLIGFFLGSIPWYIGAFILICVEVDYREKPGLIACLIAGIITVVAVTPIISMATHSW